MVQIILLVLAIVLIVLAWAIIAAVGVVLFYIMLAVAVVTILIAHGRVYFMDKYHGVSKGMVYVPVLLGMLCTVSAMTPGLRSSFRGVDFMMSPWMAVPFGLAAIYYSFGLRRIGPGLVHPYCAGAVYVDQIRASIRALPGIWYGAKMAAPWISGHWIGIIAAIAALVIGVPIAFGVLIVSTCVGLLVAMLWGAFLALTMLTLILIFKWTHKAGSMVPCPKCGRSHVMPGPGPWGLCAVRCECGETLDIWAAGKSGSIRTTIPVWYERERNIGAQSMLSLSITAALLVIGLRGIPVAFSGAVVNATRTNSSSTFQNSVTSGTSPGASATAATSAPAARKPKKEKLRANAAPTSADGKPHGDPDPFVVRDSYAQDMKQSPGTQRPKNDVYDPFKVRE